MCSWSKTRCGTSSIFPTRATYLSIRFYANIPQPRPNSPPKSTTTHPSAKPSISTRSPLVPLQSVLPTESHASRINPPSSTHSPPLKLPSRAPTLPAYKHYYSTGKAYLSFYKTGLKAIWTNFKLIRALPNKVSSKNAAEILAATQNGTLSRANFQLILRTSRDLWNLPTFGLIFLICGEFTPLVIVFMTGLVPRIIWIPKQVQSAREKVEKRRREAQRQGDFEMSARDIILQDQIPIQSSSEQKMTLKYIAQSLNLYSPVLDRYFPFLLLPALVRGRVNKRLEDLRVDDFAIARDGGVQSMSAEEVILACEERGMDVLEKEEDVLREQLSGWVERRKRNWR